MKATRKPRAHGRLGPKECHMFGAGPLSCVGDSIESIVKTTAVNQFMELQSWVFQSIRGEKKSLARANRLFPRFTALQLPFTVPSCSSGCWQAVNGGSQTVCAFPKKGLPPPSSEGRPAVYICAETQSIPGITFALRPCSVIQGGFTNHCWAVTEHLL